jgi:hypothetical protein
MVQKKVTWNGLERAVELAAPEFLFWAWGCHRYSVA